jgi:hypothetical protein
MQSLLRRVADARDRFDGIDLTFGVDYDLQFDYSILEDGLLYFFRTQIRHGRNVHFGSAKYSISSAPSHATRGW